MRKIFSRLLSIMLVLCMVFGCMEPMAVQAATKKSSASLSAKSLTLYTGQSKTLKLKGAKGTVTWKSKKKSVAKVSKGKVTGVKSGKTTITAKNKGKTYSCKVTVKKPSLSASKLTLECGSVKVLKVTGTSIKKVSSSNTKVAAISTNGEVEALGCGTATVSVVDNYNNTMKCVVKVTPGISANTVTVKAGETATVSVIGATIKSVSSEDESVATVDNNGTIKGIAAGSTTVSITNSKGTTHKITVNVTDPKADVRSFTVQFHTPEGIDTSAAVLPEDQKVEEGTPLSSLDTPEIPGYVFVGWAYDEAGTELAAVGDTVTKAMDLYAVMAAEVTDAVAKNTFVTAADVSTDYVVKVQADSEDTIRSEVTLTGTSSVNNDTALSYKITKNGDYYELTPEDAYAQGETYIYTRTDDGDVRFVYNDEVYGEDCVTYNVLTKAPEQSNDLSLASGMRYIKKSEIRNLTGNYESTIFDTDSDESDSKGTFEYDGTLSLGDSVAVYEGVNPEERTLSEDQTGDAGDVMWLKITKVGAEGEDGYRTYSFEAADFKDIVNVPDNLPLSTRLDTDGDKTNYSMTIPTDDLSFTDSIYESYNIDPGTTVDEGDFLCLYDGEPDVFDQNTEFTFACVTKVTQQGDNTVIAYRDATASDIQNSVNVYEESTDIDILEDYTDEEIEAMEAEIKDQVKDSEFIEDTQFYLAEEAVQKDEIRELIGGLDEDETCELVLEDGTEATEDDLANGEDIYLAAVSDSESSGSASDSDVGTKKTIQMKGYKLVIDPKWVLEPVVNMSSDLTHYKKMTGVSISVKLAYEIVLQKVEDPKEEESTAESTSAAESESAAESTSAAESSESTAAETSAKESSAAETSAKESSAAETSAKESSAAETSAKESSAAETSAKESSAAETSAKESTAAESGTSESSSTESSATESSTAGESTAESTAAETTEEEDEGEDKEEIHIEINFALIAEAGMKANATIKYVGGWKVWEGGWKTSLTFDYGASFDMAVEASAYTSVDEGSVKVAWGKEDFTSKTSANDSIKAVGKTLQTMKYFSDKSDEQKDQEATAQAFLSLSDTDAMKKSLPERYSEMLQREGVEWFKVLTWDKFKPKEFTMLKGTIKGKFSIVPSLQMKVNATAGMTFSCGVKKRIIVTGFFGAGTDENMPKQNPQYIDTEQYYDLTFYAMGMVGIKPDLEFDLDLSACNSLIASQIAIEFAIPLTAYAYAMAELSSETGSFSGWGAYYFTIDYQFDMNVEISVLKGLYKNKFNNGSITKPLFYIGSASAATGFSSGTQMKDADDNDVPNTKEMSLDIEDTSDDTLELDESIFKMYALNLETGVYHNEDEEEEETEESTAEETAASSETSNIYDTDLVETDESLTRLDEEEEDTNPVNYMYDTDPFVLDKKGVEEKDRVVNTDTYFEYKFTGDDASAFSYDPKTRTVKVNNDGLTADTLEADLTFVFKGKWAPASSVKSSDAPTLVLHLKWENKADRSTVKVSGESLNKVFHFNAGQAVTVYYLDETAVATLKKNNTTSFMLAGVSKNWFSNNGVNMSSDACVNGTKIFLFGSPEKAGYDFAGWVSDNENVKLEKKTLSVSCTYWKWLLMKSEYRTINVMTATFTPDDYVAFTADWTPRSDVKYTVNVMKQQALNGQAVSGYYTESAEEVKTGTAGETIVPTSKVPTDSTYYYELDKSLSTKSLTISGDGRSEANLYYSLKNATVTFNPGEMTGNKVKKTMLAGTTGIGNYVPTDLTSGWEHKGYDLVCYVDSNGTYVSEDGSKVTLGNGKTVSTTAYDNYRVKDNVTLTACWTTAKYAKYKVEYYVQDSESGEYKIDTSKTRYKTGETALEYTYDSEQFSDIESDATYTVLAKVKVKRAADSSDEDTFKLDPYGKTAVMVYLAAGGIYVNAVSEPALLEEQSVRLLAGKKIKEAFKPEITVPKTETANYELTGVYLDESMSADSEIDKATEDLNGKTVYLKWELKTATLKADYYLMNEDGEYELADSQDIEVVSGVSKPGMAGTAYEGKSIYEIGAVYGDTLDSMYTYDHAEYDGIRMNETNTDVVSPEEEGTVAFYYARPNYEISFYDNNGQLISSERVLEGRRILDAQPDTTRVGYEFLGWKDADGNALSDESTAAADSSWYGEWKEAEVNVKVEYYKDYELYQTDKIKSKVGETVSVVPSEAAPEELKDLSLDTKHSVLEGKVTATAVPVLKVYYVTDFNGHYVYWMVNGSLYQSTLLKAGDTIVKPDDPEITGYEFTCWDDSADMIGSKMPDSDVTLNALTKAKTFNITYDTNGGTITKEGDKTATYGITYGTLPTAEKENYIFLGWYTAKGVKITSERTCGFTKDFTLHAKWAQVLTSYTVCHYLQNSDKTGYTENTRDEYIVTNAYSGDTTDVLPNYYAGYEAKAIEQEIVDIDGNTVVNVYYDLK